MTTSAYRLAAVLQHLIGSYGEGFLMRVVVICCAFCYLDPR